ncbi:D-2-hydroxyacid dehydrogenase [Haloarcula litorea]|uniref:D-2-hydroxyacid dehydrogenase n=1 Tax=Haloarcula litorea TaxID=3032579 RepID=UPI0023E8A4BF|nr:D-2-hydroxyacid dehydrogenase [Halomicroarcula sp. GDY20]
MEIERIAVHESVGTVCPLDAVVESLSAAPVPVETVGDDDPLSETDCVVTFGPREAFYDAAWVHGVRAGYDDFDTDAYAASDTALTNSTGIHGDTVPETVVGYLTAFARRLHVYRDRQADRAWTHEPYDAPFTLTGERVCVVGLGTIGQGVVDRVTALGMDAVGVRRSGDPAPGVERVYTPDDVEAAVADARFVVLAVPLTDGTEGLIDAAVLAAMPDDGYLVNVARGDVVVEDALLSALEEGTIAGAAVDAYWEEPLPEEHPLWAYENAILTPHCAAATNRYHEDVAELVRENVARVRRGEPLANRVA